MAKPNRENHNQTRNQTKETHREVAVMTKQAKKVYDRVDGATPTSKWTITTESTRKPPELR